MADIELLVAYGEVPELPNVMPDGFPAVARTYRRGWLPGYGTIYRDPAMPELEAQFQPDVVVDWWTARVIPSAPWRRSNSGHATLLWGHGYSKSPLLGARWLRYRRASKADGVLVYGERAAEVLSRDLATRVFLAPNAIDATDCTVRAEAWTRDRQDLLRQELGLPRNALVVGHVSRLARANRLDVAIKAIARLADLVPAIHLVIVGNGDETKRELLGLASRLEVRHRVNVLAGTYDEDRVARYMSLFDVFCYPSNAGLSIHHAFAYGVGEFVAGDDRSAHNPEMDALVNNHNGLLFRHNDAADLARVLADVLVDRPARDRLASEALATSRRYTMDQLAEAFAAAIRGAADAYETRASE